MKHLEELVRKGDWATTRSAGPKGNAEPTDDHVERIDDLLKHKESEIMEV